VYASKITVFVAAPLDGKSPIASLNAASVISACDDLILDPTASQGFFFYISIIFKLLISQC
jgi:hypothetical protein